MINLQKLAFFSLFAASMFVTTRRCEAEFLTYINTAVVSGSLNGVAFANTRVTVSGIGDTSTVYNFQGFETQPAINLQAVSLTVDGFGTGTFADPFAIRFVQGLSFVTFSDLANFSEVLAVRIPLSQPYDLTTAIGPLSGTAATTAVAFNTSLGSFRITGTSVGTFSAVPEPSSLVLCGVAGMAGLVVVRARHRTT